MGSNPITANPPIGEKLLAPRLREDRIDMTILDLGRHSEVRVELNTKKAIDGLSKYDVILCDKNGMVLRSHIGCYGTEDSVLNGMWVEDCIKRGKRYGILMDALEMAEHNLRCYSTSYTLEEPKEGFLEDWTDAKDKIETLKSWIGGEF